MDMNIIMSYLPVAAIFTVIGVYLKGSINTDKLEKVLKGNQDYIKELQTELENQLACCEALHENINELINKPTTPKQTQQVEQTPVMQKKQYASREQELEETIDELQFLIQSKEQELIEMQEELEREQRKNNIQSKKTLRDFNGRSS